MGSDILHVPYIYNFEEIYIRLNDANGAGRINNQDELSENLIKILSPDNAARLAHAAWEVSSNGAGVTDRALELINENLTVEVQEC